MNSIEINDRTEMFDMRGEVPCVYPPGHVYIIGEHEPEPGVLEYVIERISREHPMYICICGEHASLWEKRIREHRETDAPLKTPAKIADLTWSEEHADDEVPPWKDKARPGAGPELSLIVCDPMEMAEDLAAQYAGRFQPRCYVFYDDRDLAFAVRAAVGDHLAEHRKRILAMLEKLGTLEFFYIWQDFVINIGEDNVMLGRLGDEVTCDTLEEALDLPVFSDWTLLQLWPRIQGQVGRWMSI